MARLLGRIAYALTEFWWDIEGYALLYFMACGALANLGAIGYGIYWLTQHVRFV